MTQPDDYEALFREHLPLIDKIIAAVARRVGLRDDHEDEFAARVKERLWAHDYAVLRKWRRESQLST